MVNLSRTLIFTPQYEIHVKATVICAQSQGINFRVRSGGHDYEGLSYVSYTGDPFILMDMSKLRDITVDTTTRTAWAQTGATNGELYYRISQESNTLAFPAGICTSLGPGGHLSGGAYGTLMRKYGLRDDNIIDARIVKADGDILTEDAGGLVIFTPFGGRVSDINDDDIPFPHRSVLAMIQYVAQWGTDQETGQQHEDWVRELFDTMTPYVSCKPRESYVNYRDLDIGMDGSGSNCSIPALWGPKYFINNFGRLVSVKTKVDGCNIFNHEQSIPTRNSINKCTQLY